MSSFRTRRALVRDPTANSFNHHPRFTANYSRKQSCDRTLFDSDHLSAAAPPLKRRRSDFSSRFDEEEEERSRNRVAVSVSYQKEECSEFMSKEEIERLSPSRKDGIDRYVETSFRYSYCAYLQSLGMRLELPQTTIGTAMVLCHRFFVRRSHASHDRFLVATAALFLATKSEETPCLLNTVLRASCEICQRQNFPFFPYLVYSHDWFDQFRERVTEVEQILLTTLDFELDVHHPYVPLTSVLSKLGLSQTELLNLAWNLVSEGTFLQELCAHLCEILSWTIYMMFMESILYSHEVEQLARFWSNHMTLVL